MSITKIGKEAAQNSSADDGGDAQDVEYERMDVSDCEWVKAHPTTAVGGTAVGLRYVAGDPDNEGYDRGFAGLVLEEPYVLTEDEGLEGTTIFQSDDDTGDDYKVVNLDDKATKHLEGSGVDFDGNVFYGEPVDEFESDRIVLKLTGNAGRSAACALDVHGRGSADVIRDGDGTPILTENGAVQYNGALIEHAPDNDDDNYTPPRWARDPQLRPDMQGEDVAVMLQRLAEIDDDYEGNAYWTTVIAQDGDGEWDEVAPTDEFEPDDNLVEATQYLEWNFPSTERIKELQEEQGV